jgi:hypothetical protein
VTPFAAGRVGALRLVLYTAPTTRADGAPTRFTVHCDEAQTMPETIRTDEGEILTKTMDVLTVPRGD